MATELECFLSPLPSLFLSLPVVWHSAHVIIHVQRTVRDRMRGLCNNMYLFTFTAIFQGTRPFPWLPHVPSKSLDAIEATAFTTCTNRNNVRASGADDKLFCQATSIPANCNNGAR